jgi:hypothetical protein
MIPQPPNACNADMVPARQSASQPYAEPAYQRPPFFLANIQWDNADAGTALIGYRNRAVHASELRARLPEGTGELDRLDLRSRLIWQIVHPVVAHNTAVNELEMIERHRIVVCNSNAITWL